MKERKIISNREFYGDEFYVRRQQDYEEARRFLKTADDPKTTWIFSGFGSTRTKNVCRRDSSIDFTFIPV